MAICMSAGAAPSRRRFLSSAGAAAAATVIDGVARPYLSFAADRPRITHGLQSGDVSIDSGMVWARADRPARMLVEVATTESFRHIRHAAYVDVLPESDFTGKLLLEDLPPGQDIFYRVRFQNLASPAIVGEPQVGRFRTAPAHRKNVSFIWSGDTAGGGWGIDLARGGMRTYATMLANRPDFFIHSGDIVYADCPIGRAIQAAERRDVAERRHRGEIQGRRDARRVPRQLQIQSRSTRTCARSTPRCRSSRNGTITRSPTTGSPAAVSAHGDGYREKSLLNLVARGSRAFHEFLPLRQAQAEAGRIYRKISYGPLLDVFMLDMRSYRGANAGDVASYGPDAHLLGPTQLAWLKRELAALARDLEGDRRRSAARRVQP